MQTDNIFGEVKKLQKKFNTRDPFELLDCLGVVQKTSFAYPKNGLKGYCYFSKRSTFAVLNGNLSPEEIRIVAAHEAAHAVLHKDLLKLAPLRDFCLYDMKNRREYDANLFAADFLISDESVEELSANEEMDYFRMCAELCISPDLMAFKLFSMIRRGYNYRLPQGLNSGFLGK
ncbi:MAG: ImmA/IrrE family metallo-endopeptidase [Oscillospiraceae bacterium]